MNPAELPPPRAGFGLQREMDEARKDEEASANSAVARKPQRRDSGIRRVSFGSVPGAGEDVDQPSSRVGTPANPTTRAQTPETPPSHGGLPPRSPAAAFSAPSPSEASSGGSPQQPSPPSQATPGGSPAYSPSASLRPPSANPAVRSPTTNGSEGGSEASFNLNTSLRRTKRRHAAAAAATATGRGILGPAPVTSATWTTTAAAAGGAVAPGSTGTGGEALPAGTPPGSPPMQGGAAAAAAAGPEGSASPATPTPGGGAGGSLNASMTSRRATAAAAGSSPQQQQQGPPQQGPPQQGPPQQGPPQQEQEQGPAVGEGPGPQAPPPPPLITGPLYKQPLPPNALAITIARSESMRLDPLLTSPVVRVHCLDERTGQYITTLDDPSLGPLDGTQQSQMLEFPGRPALMTAGNNGEGPTPAVLKVIPPIQTRPFQLLSRPELRNLAAWEEVLLVDEAVERLLALDVLLLFEVLQPPVSYHRYRKHVRAHDPADGCHLVAWGFLRPAGPRAETPGAPPQPLLGRLKLQLYEYKKDISDAVRVNASRATGPPRPGPGLGATGGHYPGDYAAAAAGGAGAGTAPSLSPPVLLNAASRTYVNYQALMAKGGAAVVPKYPSALTVVLQMVPRPPPEVVTTEPDKDIRPYLPAGYGSGFETSKVPLSAYLLGVGADGQPLDSAGAGEDVTKHKFYRPITEPCKIPNTQLRQLPGGPQGVTCIAFSHSGLHLAVAWAEADDRARVMIYKTLTGGTRRTIHCAHNGFVYEIAWARDDSAIITASADGTAKVWELNPAAAAAAMAAAVEAAAAAAAAADGSPSKGAAATASGGGAAADAAAVAAAAAPAMNLLTTMKPPPATAASQPPTAPGTPNATLNTPRGGGAAAAAATGAGTAATTAARAGGDAMPHPTLLRHACYVYTAQFHPVQKPGSALVATGAYDGTVRLWRRYTGELLTAVKTQHGCINSLCFDKLGTRLYAGDSAGVLQEFSCDVSKGVDAVAAAPGGTNLKISTITTGSPAAASALNTTLTSATIRSRLGTANLSGSRRAGASPGAPGSSSSSPAPVNLNASMLPRSRFNASVRSPGSAAATGSPGDGGNASLRSAGGGGGGGLNATMASTAASESAGAVAAANILRVLRQCDEFDGEPLSHVFLHNDGRRLGVLTKRSRLLVVETRSLSRAEQFLGLRCREAPMKATFSPDGRYLACGSEDGRVVAWDANGGPPTLLPHFGLGGDTVQQVVWNPQFHIAAVCSFASWAPVLLLAYDSSLPDVAMQMGNKSSLELMGRDRKPTEVPRRKWDIPDQLTPDFLRIMLNDIRRDARERKILGNPNDPYGDHLVVPRNKIADLRFDPASASVATTTDAPSTPTSHRPAGPSAATASPGDDDTASAGGSLRLPGSRFPAPSPSAAAPADAGAGDSGANDSLQRSRVKFADELPPPAFKDSAPPPPPSQLPQQPAEMTQSPPARAAQAQEQPEPPIQEYQWQHPQRKPPTAGGAATASQKQGQEGHGQQQQQVAPPAPVRQQQPQLQPQLYAHQQRHPLAAAASEQQQQQQQYQQPYYVRQLYQQEQEHEWNHAVPQLPDPLQYSQMQRAREAELLNAGRPPVQYPQQPREAQLQQYEQQVSMHEQHVRQYEQQYGQQEYGRQYGQRQPQYPTAAVPQQQQSPYGGGQQQQGRLQQQYRQQAYAAARAASGGVSQQQQLLHPQEQQMLLRGQQTYAQQQLVVQEYALEQQQQRQLDAQLRQQQQQQQQLQQPMPYGQQLQQQGYAVTRPQPPQHQQQFPYGQHQQPSSYGQHQYQQQQQPVQQPLRANAPEPQWGEQYGPRQSVAPQYSGLAAAQYGEPHAYGERSHPSAAYRDQSARLYADPQLTERDLQPEQHWKSRVSQQGPAYPGSYGMPYGQHAQDSGSPQTVEYAWQQQPQQYGHHPQYMPQPLLPQQRAY